MSHKSLSEKYFQYTYAGLQAAFPGVVTVLPSYAYTYTFTYTFPYTYTAALPATVRCRTDAALMGSDPVLRGPPDRALECQWLDTAFLLVSQAQSG